MHKLVHNMTYRYIVYTHYTHYTYYYIVPANTGLDAEVPDKE